jgi:hypothetical protein
MLAGSSASKGEDRLDVAIAVHHAVVVQAGERHHKRSDSPAGVELELDRIGPDGVRLYEAGDRPSESRFVLILIADLVLEISVDSRNADMAETCLLIHRADDVGKRLVARDYRRVDFRVEPDFRSGLSEADIELPSVRLREVELEFRFAVPHP